MGCSVHGSSFFRVGHTCADEGQRQACLCHPCPDSPLRLALGTLVFQFD